MYENQFGFRKSHSTHMALLTLMDKLVHAIENGEYVMGVFLDFSKAFDTVKHSILLDKLYHYGIRGCAHKWLKSYLTNRTQFVTYNSTVSDHQMIKCGVPEGSILGPLLFLVNVNDFPSVCSSALPILFADDTNFEWQWSHLYWEQDEWWSKRNIHVAQSKQIVLEYKKDTFYGILWQKQTQSQFGHQNWWRIGEWGWENKISRCNYW